jgi:hypothetical protein
LVLVLLLGFKQLLCKHEFSAIYGRFKIAALYADACGSSVRGTPKRLVLFQILCETYIYVNSYIIPFASAIYGYTHEQTPNLFLHSVWKSLKSALLL